ncbi:MAG: hypothetical protein ABIN36_08365 [Ferruginibacter sp.]
MAQLTKKKILIYLLVLGIGATAVAFYLYNKGPLDVRGSNGLAVKAVDLYHIFSTDSTVAGSMYIDKILAVQGIVKEVNQKDKQQQVILLKTSDDGAAVNCTMESPIANVSPSDKLIIKGICSGIGQGDTELGIPGDVYLTRCYSEKK